MKIEKSNLSNLNEKLVKELGAFDIKKKIE